MTAQPEWSEYQRSIFDFVRDSNRSALVQAVAGSGKTTTIVEAANLIPPEDDCLFLAFNKAIADELQARLPEHFTARTLNSLGHGAVYKANNGGKVTLDDKKVQKIFDELFAATNAEEDRGTVIKLVGLAKSYALSPDNDRDWWDFLIDHHGLYTDKLSDFELVDCARQILRENNRTWGVIDFNDQIYLPAFFKIRPKQYKTVFVDEAQDLSRAQRILVQLTLAPGGRVIAVGDRAQAIYGWRGASHDSMDKIRDAFDCVELPLSICYRCPSKVIDLAKTIVPEIEARPGAPEGDVQHLGEYTPQDFRATDLIVSRKNAPLVSFAYQLLGEGVACHVMGRDIGKSLMVLIGRFKADTVGELLEKVDTWGDREAGRLFRADKEAQAQAVLDKCATLRVIASWTDSDLVADLMTEIEQMFVDEDDKRRKKQTLRLATVHKAKGLEADRVWVLQPGDMPAGWAKKDWEQIQERNLQYVAYTRPKESLFFIESDGFTVKKPEQKEVAAA